MAFEKREVRIIEEVISLLSGSPELLDRFRREIDGLKHRKELAKANKFRLAVMGVTSSGKSTMLNALLGKSLLPSVAIPSSSQLVSCVKGSDWGATVYFENGRKKLFSRKELSPQLIRDYGEEKYNPGNKKGVSQIEITSPLLLTPEDLIMEDSPGLDAYGLEGHEHITMHMLLPSTDFCIFVTTCKTNSDHKTLEVLNEIAKYQKPVIIVQNMVDSVKALPDGSKSATEVAKDHIIRVQRIIDKSNIKDKRTVHIVQISAVYAMEVREFLVRGNNSYEKSRKKWKESNFDELCKVISEVFNQIKPQIEAKRLSALKRELIEINSNIVLKDIIQAPVESLNFRDIRSELSELINVCKARIDSSLQSITVLAKKYKDKYACTQYDIDKVKVEEERIAGAISNVMSDYNRFFDKICEKLNISTRDFAIRIPQRIHRSISAAYKTETYRVKKDGFWNSVKRFFGSSSGYEVRSRPVIDEKENQRRIIVFLQQAYDDLAQKTEEWLRKIYSVKQKVYSIIDNKEAQYREAQEAAYSSRISEEKKKSIKLGLQRIINEIPESCNRHDWSNGGNRHHTAEKVISRVELPQDTHCLINISKDILSETHQIVWRSIIEKKGCDVVTWDLDSAHRFIHTSLGISFSSQTSNLYNTDGFGYVKIIDVNSSSDYVPSDRKMVFMVNATQPGAAKKQLKSFIASNGIQRREVIFVIQDLQEVINGGDLSGSLHDLNLFLKSLNLTGYLLLPYHPNPLYCIAMLENHRRKIVNHSEEMKLLSELKSRLSYLFEELSANIIAEIIRR